MKLMMICDYPMTPSDINGGVAAAAYNLIHALLEHTDIQIVAIGYWPGFTANEPMVTDQGRLRIIRCPQPRPRAHLRGHRSERRIFNHFIRSEKPDVIHAQSEGIYATVAVNSGVPNVYTIHGVRLKELDMERSEIGTLSYLLRTRLIRQHHKKAKNIVAINRYTEQAIEGLHRANLRLIHNAVDERFFDLYDEIDTTPGKLLLVGGIRLRKDIVTCLKAVSELVDRGKPVSLDIVGPNDAECLSEAEQTINACNLQGEVTIHGLVSSDAVENFYRHADIFVMSSVEESSPIAIVQAMAAGKPVVSTDVGGIAEMIADGQNGNLVECGDFKSLADNIERLIYDRVLHRNFCEKSRQLAIDEWSPKAVALKSYEMYKEMISET